MREDIIMLRREQELLKKDLVQKMKERDLMLHKLGYLGIAIPINHYNELLTAYYILIHQSFLLYYFYKYLFINLLKTYVIFINAFTFDFLTPYFMYFFKGSF